MATQHLDLDEQEQLDQLKAFWKQYGNALTWLVTLALLGYAGWTGYQVWENRKAAQASTLYEAFDKAAQAGDLAKVDRALADLSADYGGTLYAQQARLLAAKLYVDKGNLDAAKTALQTVVEKAPDEGYKALARLRLASVLADQKNYDAALKLLGEDIPKSFEALASDRRGDILALQGQKEQAKAAYELAYKQADETAPYRGMIEVKMRALGIQPAVPAASSPASQAQPG